LKNEELPRVTVGSVLRDKDGRRFVVKGITRRDDENLQHQRVADRSRAAFNISLEPRPEALVPHKAPRRYKDLAVIRQRLAEIRQRLKRARA
jgi:hypothetical protein